MNFYKNCISIAIKGEKNDIIRMLNAAIRNVGTGNVISINDDIEAINKKIKVGMVSLTDLIDEEALKDSIIQNQKKISFESEEEEEYTSDGRVISIFSVSESGNNLEVQMGYDLGDDDDLEDCPHRADWVDICRLYALKIIVKDVQYLNGRFDGYCYFAVHKKSKDGSVKSTEIKPAQSFSGYVESLREILREDPLSVSDIINDLELTIKMLQEELSEKKLLVALNSLDETNGHLQVPEGVTEISDVTWKYGEKIKSIYIPASVTVINMQSISSSNIETIEISPNNPCFCSVNNCILNKEKTTLLGGCCGSVIPDGITRIENSAFRDCRGLVEVKIQTGVKEIGLYAFLGCVSLRSVVLPETLDDLPLGCFSDCTSLTNVTLPDHLKDTGLEVFRNTPYGGGLEEDQDSDLWF